MSDEVGVVEAAVLVRREVGVGWVEAEAALGGIGDEEDQSVGEEVEGFVEGEGVGEGGFGGDEGEGGVCWVGEVGGGGGGEEV